MPSRGRGADVFIARKDMRSRPSGQAGRRATTRGRDRHPHAAEDARPSGSAGDVPSSRVLVRVPFHDDLGWPRRELLEDHPTVGTLDEVLGTAETGEYGAY